MGSLQEPSHSFSSRAKAPLPESLIEFLKSSPASHPLPALIESEPPPKRKRTSSVPTTAVTVIKPIQYIILRWTTINISFPRPRATDGVHYRSTAPVRIRLSPTADQTFNILIEYLPTNWHEIGINRRGRPPPQMLLDTELAAIELPIRDVELAMLKDIKWPLRSGQGKIWADTTLTLYRNDDSDHLAISIGLKWEKTETLLHVPKWSQRTMLQRCLNAYLPDRSDDEDGDYLHTPQAFYKCAYTPEKDDPIASSLKIPDVDADLYPFQKRAVQWLLRREGVQWSGSEIKAFQEDEVLHDNGLPASFTRAVDDEGTEFFFSDQMKLATTNIEPFRNAKRQVRGGILSEEMGLGKTIEIISLITLHKCPRVGEKLTIPDGIDVADDVLPIQTTLIIIPGSLLSQWISEFDHHSPNLKVMHYEGLKKNSKISFEELRQEFAAHDVVITTYEVLTKEVHFVRPAPQRHMRKARGCERATSPLPKCLWWRVCLDEAQMIQGGISSAAQVALMIPRIIAWGISGTPVKRGIADLHGLLIFLKYEPYASNLNLWSQLLHSPRNFAKCFNKLALRHTKQFVRDEIRLPPQKRFVITMPFSAIEEQHYQNMFQAMASECGMDLNGDPLSGDWEPNYAKMRAWLIRLRQTALHPEVGSYNRRALGRDSGPLRTLDEIVVAMLENIDQKIRTDERSRLMSKLVRGQMLENSPRVNEALAIWSSVLEEASAMSKETRKQLEEEIELSKALLKNGKELPDSAEDVEDAPNIGAIRHRLRGALELEHMAVFFQGNAYFQLRERKEDGSEEDERLEKKEKERYARAKALRHEILREVLGKATNLMTDISRKARKGNLVQIPKISFNIHGGSAELRQIVAALTELGVVLNAQAEQLVRWRKSVVQLLTKPLVDDDDEVAITGGEYEESTKTQEEVMVLIMALRSMVSDRGDIANIGRNFRTEVEVKSALALAKEGSGLYPQKTLEVLQIRQRFLPHDGLKTLRAVLSEVRSMMSEFRAAAGNQIEAALHTVQNLLSEQNKANQALERELELFTTTMNTRVDYYRQLQHLSDQVASYDGEISDLALEMKLGEEQKLVNEVAAARTKRRYFVHLQSDALNSKTRLCIICQDEFELGVFTKCGHSFCKQDFKLWSASHHTCPTCKTALGASDVHNIVCKSQVLQGQVDSDMANGETANEDHGAKNLTKSKIYSEISSRTLAQIKNIKLAGNGTFTTKVDTLAKHIIWLRQTDPGAKSIVFCQYKEFLHVLALAFTKYKIGHESIEKRGGIDRFKEDPSKEVFLLHARANASGLNLVNASHVFLCEPLLQTALELQAIARVDRIGQRQSTTVWLYLIDGTVEESIYDISVERRLEHIGKSEKGKSRDASMDPEALEGSLEMANAMELRNAGMSDLFTRNEANGEVVPDSELWKCLFGSRRRGRAMARPKGIPNGGDGN